MFKHSTRVPRLYKIAAKIAKDAKEGVDSIKNLVYEHKKKHPNIKAVYALVTTLFQKNNEIENLLKKSQFLIKEPRADPWLTKILIVELLWGKKRLPGDSVPEKTIQAYEQVFKAHITNTPVIKIENDTQGDAKPRYVRINTLFISFDEAVEGFRNEGWKLCKFFDKTDYKGFLHQISSLSEDEFMIDIHVPNLLIFPPKTQFYNHPAYKDGSIILQDKASCLPVHILNPPPGSVALDMCASPGMKTTQLAAVMNDQGTVYAVERNPKRFETLNRIVESSKATCIKTENKDVLTCNSKDFKDVQYILVDPSCSGSGMTDRLDYAQGPKEERMEKLAGFQIKIFRSALTRYPDVKRVVYSTCSVYPEENEDVVRQVIETNTKFKLVPAKQFVNDTWQNVGSSEYGEIGEYCLYAKPNDDLTNGFFVAVFERLEEDEVNQFFNTKVFNYKKHVQSQQNRTGHQGDFHYNIKKENDGYGDVNMKEELEKKAYSYEKHSRKKQKRNEGNVGQYYADAEFKYNTNAFNNKIEIKIEALTEEGATEDIENGRIDCMNKHDSEYEHIKEAIVSIDDRVDQHVSKKNKKKRKKTDVCERAPIEEENESKYLEQETPDGLRDVEVVKHKKTKKKKDRELSDTRDLTTPEKTMDIKQTPAVFSVTENADENKKIKNHPNENHEQCYIKPIKTKKKRKDSNTSIDSLITDELKEKKRKKQNKPDTNQIIDMDNDIDKNVECNYKKPKKSKIKTENNVDVSVTSVKHKKNKKEKSLLNEHSCMENDQRSDTKKSKNSIDIATDNDLDTEPIIYKKKKKEKKSLIEYEVTLTENNEEMNNLDMNKNLEYSSKKRKNISTELEDNVEVAIKIKKKKHREL